MVQNLCLFLGQYLSHSGAQNGLLYRLDLMVARLLEVLNRRRPCQELPQIQPQRLYYRKEYPRRNCFQTFSISYPTMVYLISLLKHHLSCVAFRGLTCDSVKFNNRSIYSLARVLTAMKYLFLHQRDCAHCETQSLFCAAIQFFGRAKNSFTN